MDWLVPSLIAVLFGSVILTGVFLYLYLSERVRFLQIWLWGWLIYSLRFVFMLHLAYNPDAAWAVVAGQLSAVWSALLIAMGTAVFAERRFSALWTWLAVAASVWITCGVILGFPFLWITLPGFVLSGIVFCWTGIVMIRASHLTSPDRYVLGTAFLLWGLHKVDYPFIHTNPELAPYGYLLAAGLELVVALSMILIYFSRSRDLIRRRESALMESEKRVRTIFEQVAVGFCELDLDTRFLRVNRRLCDMIGFSEEELLEIELRDFCCPADKETLSFELERLAKGEAANIRTEAQWRCRDGSLRWVNLTLSATDGESPLLLGVVQDVERRKEAERALVDSEEKYRSLFALSADALLILKGDEIIDANQQAGETFSSSPNDLIGRPIWDLQPSTQANETPSREGFEKRLTAVGAGHRQEFSWLYRRLDGALIDTETICNRVELSGVSVVMVSVRDITQRRRMERRRQQLEQELIQAQKMEAVGRLAGGVAHDFRNMLTAIIWSCEMGIGDTEGRDGKESDLFQQILECAQHASDLTRQLLVFSRNEGFQPVTVHGNELISKLLKILKRVLGEDIQIRFEPGAESDEIQADPSQLEQIVMNLAINARDAMPGGGILTIRTENVLERISSVPHSRHFLIEVEDTGHGMDEEIQQRIFEPFFTTKEAAKGTGLGLSTVYGIVQQHQGHISVESRPEEGARFRVHLPQEREGAPEPLVETEQLQQMPAGSETLMLVEDEGSLRLLIWKVLTKLGYNVLVAADAEEGKRIYDPSVELLITDVVLPGVTGPELVRTLRPEAPELKVIFMSGYAEHEVKDLERYKPAIFLKKPFPLQELAARVRDMLDG